MTFLNGRPFRVQKAISSKEYLEKNKLRHKSLIISSPRSNTMIMYFLLYILLIGAFSFTLFGVDKRKSQKGKRRISEKMLLGSVGLGGFIGGVLGMSVFRHKTIKGSFLWRFWLLVGVWLVISVGMLLYF